MNVEFAEVMTFNTIYTEVALPLKCLVVEYRILPVLDLLQCDRVPLCFQQ